MQFIQGTILVSYLKWFSILVYEFFLHDAVSNLHFQIAQVLKNICNVVPDTYTELCSTLIDGIIDENIDVIVDVIQNNIGDSKNACYTLSACP